MKVKLLMVFPCYSLNDDRYIVTSSSFLLILIIHVFFLFICVSLARDLSILLILKEPVFIFLLSILLLSALIFIISFGIYSHISLPAILYSSYLKNLLVFPFFQFILIVCVFSKFPKTNINPHLV